MKTISQATVRQAGEERGVRTAIVAGEAGANAIVAAVPGRRIVVVGGKLVASTAGTIEWRTGVTPISGIMDLGLSVVVDLAGSMLATDMDDLLGLECEATCDGWVEFVLV